MNLQNYYVRENKGKRFDCYYCDIKKDGKGNCPWDNDECPLSLKYYFKKR